MEAGLFGERDEFIRRNETADGMLPASECLETSEEAGAKLDERLKVRDYLVPFKGSAQIDRVVFSHGRNRYYARTTTQ